MAAAEPDSGRARKLILLGLPALLLISTAAVFRFGGALLGRETGYLLGFLFYWGVWCLLIPRGLLGRKGIGLLFREKNPLWSRRHWPLAGLLLATSGGAAFLFVEHLESGLSLPLLVAAVPVALVNGAAEEVLWRGLYRTVFPQNPWLGVLYPAAGFALWHLAPQLLHPAAMAGGPLAFAAVTFPLGLVYGVIAYRTGSIRWTAASHGFNGILDLGGAIAPALLTIAA